MTVAALFYEAANAGLGDDFLDDIQHAIDTIRERPELGPAVASGFRRMLVRRFPFSIIYAVEPGQERFEVKWMCEKLEVSRSGFYAWCRRPESVHSRRDQALTRRIGEYFEGSSGTYGSPRIHALLRREGERVGRKRVARLMRQLRLKARANLIYRRFRGAAICHLDIGNQAREREVTGPNQIWRGDITYLHVGREWRYLAVVLDQYSRRCLGYQLGQQRTTDLTVAALKQAIAKRRPPRGLVFHSDRGSEYAGYHYRDRLAGRGIVQSMNRPKTMTDNAYVESFFHTLKSDVIHGQRFGTTEDLDDTVRRYIARYNRSWLHSALGLPIPH